MLAALKAKYPEIKTLADVTPAVGIANAYDAMHLTALAIAKAGSTDARKSVKPITRSTSTTA
jgi:branched-chain amino acid transport system substrate-binding protein